MSRTGRRHALSILVLALAAVGATVNAGVHASDPRPFADVPADHPAAPAIAYTAEQGWFKGYGDGTFRADLPISTGHIEAVTRRAFPTGASRADTASFLVGGAASTAAWERLVDPTGTTSGYRLESSARHGLQDDGGGTLALLCGAGTLDVVWSLPEGIGPPAGAETAWVDYWTTAGKWIMGGRWTKRGSGLSPPGGIQSAGLLLGALLSHEPGLLTLRTPRQTPAPAVSSTFDIEDAELVVRVLARLCSKRTAGTADTHRTFADVAEAHTQSWDIRSAAARGWLRENGAFHPDRPLTARQISRAIRRALPDRPTRADMASFLTGGHEYLAALRDLPGGGLTQGPAPLLVG